MTATNSRKLPPTFTIHELAKELDVSVRSLQRWHDMRTGPARIKVGGKIYYRQSKVEEWLKQNEFDPQNMEVSNDD